MTYTPSPLPSPSCTATREPVLLVSIDIYGSNGELVKRLVSKVESWQTANDFKVLDGVFAPKNGSLGRIQAAGLVFSWDGTNDNGQIVSNGSYTVQMQQVDGFGHVQTLTGAMTVLSDGKTYELRVFNAAGELVRTLPVPLSSGQNAPTQIGSDSGIIVPGTSGTSGSVNFNVGSGVVAWDGRNEKGQAVTSGNYVVQLAAVNAGSSQTLGSVAVAVVNPQASSQVLAQAWAAPNPLLAGQGNRMEIRFAKVPGTRVIGRVYNLAGELVVTLANDQDEGMLVWNIQEHSLAPGIYLAALWAQTPWGQVERRTVKMVILK